MIELESHDFYHSVYVLNEKLYEEKVLESLKQIFSTSGKENDDKLRIMKLEQDALEKQQFINSRARKQVRPQQEHGVNIVNGEHQTVVDSTGMPLDMLLNRDYKYQLEVRERLHRYGMFSHM